jgi:glycosyltransferase involved in cell wall biosynthesis
MLNRGDERKILKLDKHQYISVYLSRNSAGIYMRAIVSVINDLSTDQRVHKVCSSLTTMGYQPLLVGRRQRQSLPLSGRNYAVSRMFLFFERGPLFYLFFQIRLFFFLLTHKSDVLVANDLDTLLPNYLIARLKRIPLVYDSHELFCEVPELLNSPFKRSVWKKIERFIFPRLKHVMTVNESIARIYSDEYHVPVKVVRNVPRREGRSSAPMQSRKELGLPENKRIILMQGAGINIDRGAEEALEAMLYIENALLLIIGNGDVLPKMKQIAVSRDLTKKVLFIPKLPFEKLRQYTGHADIGLTLDKDTNINYRNSLPNKLFDYIQAGVPVLASDLPEIRKIVERYQIGNLIPDHDPRTIAGVLNANLSNPGLMALWKENTKLASEKLCWEEEESVLREIYLTLNKTNQVP